MRNKIKYQKLEIMEEPEKVKAIDKTRLAEISAEFAQATVIKDDYVYIERRTGGSFSNKALYLSSKYDWALGKDEEGVLCLVPLKKLE
jgi:hypothetical protein